jgi:hypothetical protein
MKVNLENGKYYLQIMYLLVNLYPEYKKKFYNSKIKR